VAAQHFHAHWKTPSEGYQLASLLREFAAAGVFYACGFFYWSQSPTLI